MRTTRRNSEGAPRAHDTPVKPAPTHEQDDDPSLMVSLAPARFRGDPRLVDVGFDLSSKGLWVTNRSMQISSGATGALLSLSGFALGRLGAALCEVGRAEPVPAGA